MDYLQRQYRLRKFVQLLKLILSDANLVADRMPKDAFYERTKSVYFQEPSPLESKRNKAIFPRATRQFNESVENGHTLVSMQNNLDFLRAEFDDYFDDLADKKILIPNNDRPSSFRLNHNSAMVYWIIALGIFVGFVWQIAKMFYPKS